MRAPPGTRSPALAGAVALAVTLVRLASPLLAQSDGGRRGAGDLDPRWCGAGGDGCRPPGAVLWQQSTSARSVVELAVRDKEGTLGGYVVQFVVTAPDGARYTLRRRTAVSDEFVTVRFPDDFGRAGDPASAPAPVAGEYRWAAVVNRMVVVEDRFRGVRKGWEVRLEE